MRIYTGAAHAFFNDTRKEVYREGAARCMGQGSEVLQENTVELVSSLRKARQAKEPADGLLFNTHATDNSYDSPLLLDRDRRGLLSVFAAPNHRDHGCDGTDRGGHPEGTIHAVHECFCH